MIESINDFEHRHYTLAYELGFKQPDVKVLKTREDFEAYADWDIEGDIAREPVEGIKTSFWAWWDKEKFIYPSIGFRNKKLLSGDQGADLNENLLTIFEDKSKTINKYKEKLSPILKEDDFEGFISFDLIVGKELYYRKMASKVTKQFVFTFSALLGVDCLELEDFLEKGESAFKKNFACSMRVFDYPFIPKNNLAMKADLLYDEFSYIAVGCGDTIREAWDATVGKAPPLSCYRIDGSQISRTGFNDLKRKKIIP